MTKFFLTSALTASLLLAGCGGKDDSKKEGKTPDTNAAVEIPEAPVDPQIEINRKKSEEFLAAERAKDSVEEIDGGLLYETLAEGDGSAPAANDMVRFHFTGTLIDGTEFRNTREQEGKPLVFPTPLAPEITSWKDIPVPGLKDALSRLSENGRAKVIVPPAAVDSFYAETGQPSSFAPNTTLIFDVELVEVITPENEERRAEINQEVRLAMAEDRATRMANSVAQHQQSRWTTSAETENLAEASTLLETALNGFTEAYRELATASENDDMSGRQAAVEKVNAAHEAYMAAAGAYDAAVPAANAQASAAFMEEMKAKDGVTVTDSGLAYEIVTDSEDGAQPTAADTVTVHYRGTLPDGTEFDSSYSRGEPTSFPLNAVISGWTEGVALMNVGDTYRFYIPADLAYGERVRPGGPIGPNQALVFDVELLEVQTPGDQGGQ